MSIMFTTTQDITILSQGWASTRLVDIAEINPRLPLERIQDDAFVTFVPMKAVEEKTGRFDACNTKQYAEVRKGYTAFMDGDIIFAKITPCMENGKIAIMKGLKNGVGFGSTEFHVIRLTDINLPTEYFVFYLLQEQFRKDAQRNMTGSAGKLRVPAFYLEQASIPLPPLPEQHRIVAKIEELFTKLDAGVDALKKIKAQLKRYRQSVLKYAFEGKLTEEWRELHRDELEPASVLLMRIRRERKKTAIKYKEPLSINTSELPEIPDEWTWIGFAELASQNRNSIKRGPFGSAIKKSYFVENGYKVYEQQNAIYDNLLLGRYFVPQSKYDELIDFKVGPGDFIISCSGTIGRIAQLPSNAETGVINQALLKITIDNEIVLAKYFMQYFKSELFQKQLLQETRGSAMKNVSSVADIKIMPFPLSSIKEQKKIIEEIERRFSIADEIETVIWQSLKQSERLRQSILKTAFEGKLVPQDPNDEPAEKLLERIKAERARQSNKVSFSKSRSSKQKESI